MSLPKQLAAKSKSFGEKNDCAVLAVAVVCNASYEEAHATLKRLGRKDGKGTPVEVIFAAVRALGCHVTFGDRINHNGRNMQRLTVRRVGAAIPKGRWLVLCRGHVLAVKDGEVMDWTDGRRHQARFAWQVSL